MILRQQKTLSKNHYISTWKNAKAAFFIINKIVENDMQSFVFCAFCLETGRKHVNNRVLKKQYKFMKGGKERHGFYIK